MWLRGWGRAQSCHPTLNSTIRLQGKKQSPTAWQIPEMEQFIGLGQQDSPHSPALEP